MKTKLSKRLLSVLLAALLVLTSIPVFTFNAYADELSDAQSAMTAFVNKAKDGSYYKGIGNAYNKYVALQAYIDSYKYSNGTLAEISAATTALNTATSQMTSKWTLTHASVDPKFPGDKTLNEDKNITYTIESQGAKNILYSPELSGEDSSKLMGSGSKVVYELWYQETVLLNDGEVTPGFPAIFMGQKTAKDDRYIFKMYPVVDTSTTGSQVPNNDPNWNPLGKNNDGRWWGIQKIDWSYNAKDWFIGWVTGPDTSNGGGIAGHSTDNGLKTYGTFSSNKNMAQQCRMTWILGVGNQYRWNTASNIIQYVGTSNNFALHIKPIWYIGWGSGSCDTTSYIESNDAHTIHIVNTKPLNTKIKADFNNKVLAALATSKENGARVYIGALDAATAFNAVTDFNNAIASSSASGATNTVANTASTLYTNLNNASITADPTTTGYARLRNAIDADSRTDYGATASARAIYAANNATSDYSAASYAAFKEAYENAVAIFDTLHTNAQTATATTSADEIDSVYGALYAESYEANEAAAALETAYANLDTSADFTPIDEANATLGNALVDNTYTVDKLNEIKTAWNALTFAPTTAAQRANYTARNNAAIAAEAANGVLPLLPTSEDEVDLATLEASVENAKNIIATSDPDAYTGISEAKAAIDAMPTMYSTVNNVITGKNVVGISGIEYIDQNIIAPLNSMQLKNYTITVVDEAGNTLSTANADYGTTYSTSTGDGTEANWTYKYVSPSSQKVNESYLGTSKDVSIIVEGNATLTRSNPSTTRMVAVKYLAEPMRKYYKIDYVAEGSEYTIDTSDAPVYPFYTLNRFTKTGTITVEDDITVVAKYDVASANTIHIYVANVLADGNFDFDHDTEVAFNDLISISAESLGHRQASWGRRATADSYSEMFVNGEAVSLGSAADSRAWKVHTAGIDESNIQAYAFSIVTLDDMDPKFDGDTNCWAERNSAFDEDIDTGEYTIYNGKAAATEKIMALGEGVKYSFRAHEDTVIVVYSQEEYEAMMAGAQKAIYEEGDANGAASYTSPEPMVINATADNLDDGSLQFINMYYRPSNSTFVEAGFIYNYSSRNALSDKELTLGNVNGTSIRRIKATPSEFNADGSTKVKGSITIGNQYVSKVNTKNFKGRTLAVRYRAYVEYTIGGNLYIAYSGEYSTSQYIPTDAEIQ